MLKVIWLVDGFASNSEEDKLLCQRVLETLRALSKSLSIAVEPLHFIAPDSVSLNFDTRPNRVKQVTQELENLLKEICEPEDEGLLCKPRVVLDVPSSTHGKLWTMDSHPILKHAARESADLIVMGSHCRTGVTRLVRGSFAEKLFNYSPIPVLVVGSKANVPEEFEEIIFPTDFSTESVGCFDSVVSTAKSMGANLTVFHRQTAISKEESLTDFQAKKCADALVRRAFDCGVVARGVLDQNLSLSVPVAITRALGRNPKGMIMMGTTGTSESPRYQEGVTRRVLEEATTPVWIFNHNSSPK